MSNFIPMVSASPPPFDDHSFGFDDDDDFGGFTGADSHESSPDPPEPPPFEPEWGDKSSNDNEKNNNPPTETSNKTINTNNGNTQEISKTESLVNGNDEFDDFANFEEYDGNTANDVSVKKPHIENLPIQSVVEPVVTRPDETESESKDTSCTVVHGSCDTKSPTYDKDTVQTTARSRDSTTDSGMFSTDISPVPKSEDTAELCDKSCESDIEDTFPELPKDTSESTDSLPVSEEDSKKESDSRTSPVLDSGSITEECVSEDSRGDNSSVSQTQVEELDTALTKEDLSVSCSSTDQQVSPLHSRDDSQQNEKCSEDVGSSEVAADQEEEDWGDFDSAGGGSEGVSLKDVDDLDLRVDNNAGSGTNNASGVQSEDECLEAIDEALKDSENEIKDTEPDVPKIVTDAKEEGDDNVARDTDSENVKQMDSDSVVEEDASGNMDQKDYGEKTEEGDGENVKQDNSGDSDTNIQQDVVEELKEEEVSGSLSASKEEDSCDKEEENVDSGDADSNQNNIPDEEAPEQCEDTEGGDSGSKDDDEWNAFADFSEASPAGDGDNWANFQDSSSPAETKNDTPNEEDDFGDFNTANHATEHTEKDLSLPATSDKDFDESEGDWADFEESVPEPVPQISTKSAPEKPHTVPEAHSKVPQEKVEKVLSSCFPSAADNSDCSQPLQLDIIVASPLQPAVSSTTLPHKQKGPGFVWGCLRDLDKTQALVYQWSSSSANSRMFKTLHIDTQNILFGHKKQSVPIFAPNMGLLEPIRGGSSAKPHQPKPTLVDPGKADDQHGGSQELPPVEFDWDNSGLTNPLTAERSPQANSLPPVDPVINSSPSKTLDLDFLCVQESESVNKNTVFQSEILDAPRSSVKSLPPLEDVLKNMKTTTTTKRRRDEHLSTEAERIIDSLPLLSFMTSKVLMFPLRQADS